MHGLGQLGVAPTSVAPSSTISAEAGAAAAPSSETAVAHAHSTFTIAFIGPLNTVPPSRLRQRGNGPPATATGAGHDRPRRRRATAPPAGQSLTTLTAFGPLSP